MPTFPTEYEEQQAHLRLRQWMQQHGWTSVINADPAEILEFVQQHGDDADISLINNDSED